MSKEKQPQPRVAKTTEGQQRLDYHFNRLNEMIDLKFPYPQILGEFGTGKLELVFSVGMHGDEIMPIRAVQELLPELQNVKFSREGRVRFVACNVPAIAKRVRYLEEDLNGIFPGNAGGSAEARIARHILPLMKGASYVIDFHTGNYAPPFGVLPTLDENKLELLERSGINRIVLYENPSGDKTGPMVDYTNCGVGIESGPHLEDSSIEVTKQLILQYLHSFGFIEEAPTQEKSETGYFHLVDSVSFEKGAKLSKQVAFKEFEPLDAKLFQESPEFPLLYPILIDPERVYDDAFAYMAQKLNRDQLVERLRRKV